VETDLIAKPTAICLPFWKMHSGQNNAVFQNVYALTEFCVLVNLYSQAPNLTAGQNNSIGNFGESTIENRYY
jgi:hypothetical protein